MRRIRISRLQHLVLDAGSGLYSLAGHNSDLLKARHIIASLLPGTYTLAGNNATLTRQTRLLNTISGTYSYVGNPATLTWATSPNITTAPVIVGIPTVGTPVSYTAGNVTGSPTPTRTQQWLLDGNTISGATASTYTPITSDAGHNLSVRQIETNTFGSANRTSAGVVISSGTELGWADNIFPMSIQAGAFFDLAPHISGNQAQISSITSNVGFPTGVSIASSPTWRVNASAGATLGVTNNVNLTIVQTATADFASRSTGSSYAENWNSYVTAADYYNFWNRGAMVGHVCSNSKNPTLGSIWTDSFEIVTTVGHMSSGKAFRCYMGKHNYPDTSAFPSTLDNQFFNVLFNGNPLNIPAAFKTKFFCQVTIWVDTFIDYYWLRGDDGTYGDPKLFRFDDEQSTNNGEIVIRNYKNSGFVTAYRRKTDGSNTPFDRSQFTPFNSSNFAEQPAINNANPPSPTTDAQYKQKYGPMNYGMSNGQSQGSLLHLQANTPDPDAAIGGVVWARSGLTTVEVMGDCIADSVKVWAAPYGSAPKLIVNETNCGLGSRIMTNGIGWSTFEFTNLVFNASGATNPNYPIAWIDYSELICSSNPINFPGGFALP